MFVFHISKIEGDLYPLFGLDLCICFAQSQRTIENQSLITGVRNICIINDWENNIAYCKESKQSEALAGPCDSCRTVNSR